MFKKLIFVSFLLVFSFLLSFNFASAGVLINEIMYDLDGGDIDWVEVYNDGSEGVDLSTYKLLISNSTSNHGITNTEGGSVIEGGGYGVIVSSSVISKYTEKWGATGHVYTSSFSLPNVAGKVEINTGDKLSPVSTLSYSSEHGAMGNGKSLQKISDIWKESVPTPGKVNVLSSGETNNEQTEGGGSTEETGGSTNIPSSTSAPVKLKTDLKITTKITARSPLFVGLNNTFSASVLGPSNEGLFYGNYFWNFGDGASQETKVNTGGNITHTYFYPGEYTVTLEYYSNYYPDAKPDATDKINVKVVNADVLISSVGDEKDFFIELTNNTDNSIDISKWMLAGFNKRFTFPKNTIIPTKKKIIFSPYVTGFDFTDKNNLKLVNQEWKTIFDYGLSIAPVISIPVEPVVQQVKNSTSKRNSPIKEVETSEVESSSDYTPFIQGENLQAQALSSGVVDSGGNNFIYILFFVFITILGGGMVYFVRKRKVIPEIGEDFEILDE